MLKQATWEVKNIITKHNEISTPKTIYDAMETVLSCFFAFIIVKLTNVKLTMQS